MVIAKTMRRRIEGCFHFEGPALHSGRKTAVYIATAPKQSGIQINGKPVSPSDLIIPKDSEPTYCTRLQTARGPVRTVEHLLAALALLQIDDAQIAVEGDEIPILDGSALPYVKKLRFYSDPGERSWLKLPCPIEVKLGDAFLRAVPCKPCEASIEVEAEFAPRPMETCKIALPCAELQTLASARTFGFARNQKNLAKRQLALGASLQNCLVLDDNARPINGFRVPNELARHKALDLLGDLYALGRPLAAQVFAHRPGHRLHAAFLQHLITALDLERSGCQKGGFPME